MLMACQINKNKINIVSKLIKKIYGLLSIQFTNRKLYIYIKVNDVYLYFTYVGQFQPNLAQTITK